MVSRTSPPHLYLSLFLDSKATFLCSVHPVVKWQHSAEREREREKDEEMMQMMMMMMVMVRRETERKRASDMMKMMFFLF